jgi:hypothetical protein
VFREVLFGTRDFDRFLEEEELRRIYAAFLASYDRLCFFNFNEKKKLQPPGIKIKLAANKTSKRSSHQARRSTDKKANAQTSYPSRTILLNTNLSLNYSHEHEITASNLHFCCLT